MRSESRVTPQLGPSMYCPAPHLIRESDTRDLSALKTLQNHVTDSFYALIHIQAEQTLMFTLTSLQGLGWVVYHLEYLCLETQVRVGTVPKA